MQGLNAGINKQREKNMTNKDALIEGIKQGDLKTVKSYFEDNPYDSRKDDYFLEATTAGQEKVAAFIAGELTSFSSISAKSGIVQAAEKDMTSVFTAAYESNSQCLGIDGEVLKAAVDNNSRKTATLIASNITSFSSIDAKKATIGAAEKGWDNLFTAAYESKSEGLGIDGEVLEAAVNNDSEAAATVIATNIRSVSSIDAKRALESAADKGWLSTIAAAKDKLGFDKDLTATAMKNASPEQKTAYEINNTLSKMEKSINDKLGNPDSGQHPNSKFYTQFQENYGEALKTLLASDEGAKYQERLDKMLVNIIKVHTKGLEGDDPSFSGKMYDIENTLMDLGASPAYDNYAAFKAQNGEKWAIKNSKLLKQIAEDNNPEKDPVLKEFFGTLVKENKAGFVKDFAEKAGFALSTLGLGILKNANAEKISALAEEFEDSPEKTKILNDRLTGIFNEEADSNPDTTLAAALIKSGADVSFRDFKAVKAAANLGNVEALKGMLERIEDPATNQRVMAEAVVEAARGTQLEALETLGGQGADFTHNNCAAWKAIANATGDQAEKSRRYMESKGANQTQSVEVEAEAEAEPNTFDIG